jgi:hypothetical protein
VTSRVCPDCKTALPDQMHPDRMQSCVRCGKRTEGKYVDNYDVQPILCGRCGWAITSMEALRACPRCFERYPLSMRRRYPGQGYRSLVGVHGSEDTWRRHHERGSGGIQGRRRRSRSDRFRWESGIVGAPITRSPIERSHVCRASRNGRLSSQVTASNRSSFVRRACASCVILINAVCKVPPSSTSM